jgi:glycosyltransferase involved in cell wall biosynthesis
MLISVIVPVRNEAVHLERCLNSIRSQSLHNATLEILVIDGESTDQTREIVKNLQKTDPRIYLLENPQKTAPYALNIGLQSARGEVLVRVDGHCELAADYLQLCLDILTSKPMAGCVGGRLHNQGTTWWSEAIALGMSSPFGVGNALFRYTRQACEVDTLAFGAYRREVIEQVGLFNQSLTRNQDDEYNFRVRAAGWIIWLDPRIQASYYTRSSLQALWKQYYQYGYWKIKVLRQYPRSLQIRHLIPGLFVLALSGGVLTSCLSPGGWLLLSAIIAPYLWLNLYFSIKQGFKSSCIFIPALLLIFPTLHLAYGLGFLMGLPGFFKKSV